MKKSKTWHTYKCQLFSNDGLLLFGFNNRKNKPIDEYGVMADINYAIRAARTELILRTNHKLWEGRRALPSQLAAMIMSARRSVLVSEAASLLRAEGWSEGVIVNCLVSGMVPPVDMFMVNWGQMITEGYIQDPLISVVGGYSVLHAADGAAKLLDEYYSSIGHDADAPPDQRDWWLAKEQYKMFKDLDHNFFSSGGN